MLLSYFNSTWAAFLFTASVALSLEFVVKQLCARNILASANGRKTMHAGMGPVFMLCCGMFPRHDPTARVAAAFIPAMLTLKFALVGWGFVADRATTRAMSRSGNPRELLYGPVQYGVVFTLATLLQWQTAAGVFSLTTLCFGDAAAEIFGTRWGREPVPWAAADSKKTIVGTIAFVVASTASTLVMMAVLSLPPVPLPVVVAICAVAAFAESRCAPDTDNVVVFLAALGACYAFEVM